jgi:sortase (surface protein transpeptidase)
VAALVIARPPLAASEVRTSGHPHPRAEAQAPVGPHPLPTSSAAPKFAPPAVLRIPKIGLRADVVELGLNPDGAIQPPGAPTVVGWFASGPSPGDPGPAVILGHLDSDRGPAVFWHLSRLRPGDTVVVSRSDGSVARFRVTRVARFARSSFPNAEVYGPTLDPELRLITCGGWFNAITRQYADNTVVFAQLA